MVFFENNRLTSTSWCCTMARQRISNIRCLWLVKPACAKDFCMIKSKFSFPSKWLLTVYIVSCDKLWSTWRFLPFKKKPNPLVSKPGAAFFCGKRYLLTKPRINCREVGETTATIWTKLWSFDNRKCGQLTQVWRVCHLRHCISWQPNLFNNKMLFTWAISIFHGPTV